MPYVIASLISSIVVVVMFGAAFQQEGATSLKEKHDDRVVHVVTASLRR
ncbi:hypothetical protein [Brevibacillus massiliensis]|nr:hypothetical protein [Brevibacillus massiliensis]